MSSRRTLPSRIGFTSHSPSRSAEFLRGTKISSDFVPAWLYRYEELQHGWTLAIATYAEPQSGKLSLGGFRIVPEARAAADGFTPEREALSLARGMEGKVSWSRMLKVSGPLGRSALERVVGGKCVLLPSKGSRVGERGDLALLEFAVECLQHFEAETGISLTTGEDLGHGILSDGSASSLQFLSRRFQGCIIADTSRPTAEGNFQMLQGLLAACRIDCNAASIGLIGCGNIGKFLLERLSTLHVHAHVLEPRAETRAWAASQGARVYPAEEKLTLLGLPLDAIAVNAFGGSLDTQAVGAIVANPKSRIVCGCENLALVDPDGDERMRAGRKLFCPTELCGMMGYLTAVEEYLSRRAGIEFKVESMFLPARELERVGRVVGEAVLKEGFRYSFAESVRNLFQ